MTTTTIQKPENESARVEALKRYDILDTPPDGSFDNITNLAAKLFNMPIAIVSLVDEDRIWFKSTYGLDARQIDRLPGLCASAILSDEVYIVENAIEDPRTLANPLVAGELGLRFYGAAPLITKDGYRLGTLCVIDKKQRYLTVPQKAILEHMASIVMDEIELRLAARQLCANTSNHLKEMMEAIDGVSLHAKNLVELKSTSKELIRMLEKGLIN
jgi:GAF domain-containing protein